MKYFLLASISGALYAFAFPNFLTDGWFILSPIALILLVYVLEKIENTKRRCLLVLSHQLTFNLTGFYWVPHTLQEFGGLPPGISHIISLFLAPILNPSLWGWILWLHFRGKIPGQKMWSTDLNVLFGAILFTSLEILIPQQFPVYAGHVWMHFDQWLNFASIGGVSLYSFFTWWIVLSLAPLLMKRKISYAGLVGGLCFIVGHFFMPQWSMPKDSQEISVRVVQANIGNFIKIESEAGVPGAIEDVVTRYKALSLKENPQSVDLIIWPETAYPFSMSSKEFKEKISAPATLFRDIIAMTGSEILFGGYDNDGENMWSDRFETEYNAAFHIGTQGEFKQVYRKHILIPFGETMPFGPLNKKLSTLIPSVSFFARGYDFPIFTTKKGPRFVVPICYEILQPSFVAELLNKPTHPADFIINLTNDSWYGKTAEPYQHLFLAKWRAVEFRRPIIRSTNTGITTIIYPNGLEGRRMLTGEKDVLDVSLEMPLESPQTIFQVWGFLPMIGLWILLSIVMTTYWWWKIRPAANRANE